jgi:hypothetical protein
MAFRSLSRRLEVFKDGRSQKESQRELKGVRRFDLLNLNRTLSEEHTSVAQKRHTVLPPSPIGELTLSGCQDVIARLPKKRGGITPKLRTHPIVAIPKAPHVVVILREMNNCPNDVSPRVSVH